MKPVPAEAPGLPSLPACLWPGPQETWRHEPGDEAGVEWPILSEHHMQALVPSRVGAPTREGLLLPMWQTLALQPGAVWEGVHSPGHGASAPLLYCVFDRQSEGPPTPNSRGPSCRQSQEEDAAGRRHDLSPSALGSYNLCHLPCCGRAWSGACLGPPPTPFPGERRFTPASHPPVCLAPKWMAWPDGRP